MWKRLKALWTAISHLDTAISIITSVPWYTLFFWVGIPLGASVLAAMEGLPLSAVFLIGLSVLVLLVALVSEVLSMRKQPVATAPNDIRQTLSALEDAVDEAQRELELENIQAMKSELATKQEQINKLVAHAEAVSVQCDSYKKSAEAFRQSGLEQVNLVKERQSLLDDTTARLDRLQKEYDSLRHDYGRFQILRMNNAETSLGLTVAIQFIDAKDEDLAHRIRAIFWSEFPNWPWKKPRIESTRWFQNPSTKTRIVIFSDHPHAQGIKGAMNDFGLLDERVATFGMDDATDQQMIADLVFVIFLNSAKDN